jgi:catechol 2,3-dioxygenase-like lactoylglutathione lyase family enzyme
LKQPHFYLVYYAAAISFVRCEGSRFSGDSYWGRKACLSRPYSKEVYPVLADRLIHTALPATDLERARRFYAEKLGLTPEVELPDIRDGLFYRCSGGSRFLIFPSPNASSGAHTQMTWRTTDIEAEVTALKARGVIFEEYDTPEVKTINSVATIGQSKGAWFRDSEGNLLALGQFE